MAAVIQRAVDRFFESYAEVTEAYNQRVANGTQPSFFFVLNVKNTCSHVDGAGAVWRSCCRISCCLVYPVLCHEAARKALELEANHACVQRHLRWSRWVCVLLPHSICSSEFMCGAAYVQSKLYCNQPDVESENGKMRAFGLWLYYIQKYFEFLDTVFFILKKSWRQVTFLHIYHHASVALVVRQFVLYDINGDSYVAAFLNRCHCLFTFLTNSVSSMFSCTPTTSCQFLVFAHGGGSI